MTKGKRKSAGKKEAQKQKAGERHILLVDDDPIFGAVMGKLARRNKVRITICGSLAELEDIKNPGAFDAAIVDYYLDDLELDLKGSRVARLFSTTPVVLISRTQRCLDDSEAWPDSVRKFVPKEAGGEAILAAAIQSAGIKN